MLWSENVPSASAVDHPLVREVGVVALLARVSRHANLGRNASPFPPLGSAVASKAHCGRQRTLKRCCGSGGAAGVCRRSSLAS